MEFSELIKARKSRSSSLICFCFFLIARSVQEVGLNFLLESKASKIVGVNPF